ncbi:DUF883 family protein [Sphingobium algorifonticola]|nr:DUF883 family protein [Sphingobium algorifonticola]
MKNDIHEQLDRVREIAGETAEAAAERLKTVRDSTADSLARSREKAAIVYNDARDKSYRAADRANTFVQEHPIAATAAAVAAGAMIALIFPKGRALARSVPGALSAVGARAGQIASVAVDALEHRAQDIRSGAGHAATEARTAIGHAGAKASDVADAAAGLARDAIHAAEKVVGNAVEKASDRLRK